MVKRCLKFQEKASSCLLSLMLLNVCLLFLEQCKKYEDSSRGPVEIQHQQAAEGKK
jgi:hypothetical protein